MTAQEFLYDTIHHYNLDNRCVTSARCTYSPITIGKENSEGCAIGRWIDPELALQIDKERVDSNASIHQIINLYPFPDWMKKLDIEFLKELQGLHDANSSWKETGLSEHGKRYVRYICETFNLDYEQLNLN